jgi:hypothetical protein
MTDMFQDDPAWIAHQRARWLRPDAHLFVRPDAHRFMPAGAPRLVGKDAVRYFWPDSASERRAPAHDHEHDSYLAAARASLFALKRQVTALAFELKFRRLLREKAYNPHQPRVPAGNPDGGQWTRGSGQAGENQYAQATLPGGGRARGHHYVPQGVYGKLPLPPETRRVFDEATTGRLHDIRSNKYDSSHRSYNEAVTDLFERFVETNKIQVEQMTPDQAHRFLKEVLDSRDYRIRNFNMRLWLRDIMRRLPRAPRGNE